MDCDDMCAHIKCLIAKLREDRFRDPDDLHVYWIDDRNKAQTIHDSWPVELRLPKIRSAQDYGACLHELGHLCGPYQKSPYVLTRERWAWKWARKTALQWTPEMEQDAQESMKWYEDQIRSGSLPRRY